MKRFTETEKWNDPWFRALSPEDKLAWLYLCDVVDNAGVKELDEGLANFCIGYDVDWERFRKHAGERVAILKSGKYHVVKFMAFQYPEKLERLSNLHKNAVSLCHQHGIPIPSGWHADGIATGIGKGKGKGRGGSVRGEVPARVAEKWQRQRATREQDEVEAREGEATRRALQELDNG